MGINILGPVGVFMLTLMKYDSYPISIAAALVVYLLFKLMDYAIKAYEHRLRNKFKSS